MTHLFDTNAWLRSIERPEELSTSVSSLIFAPNAAPFALSAISIYELGQKARKGKLEFSMPMARWLAIALRPAVVQVIPIDAEIAREANELPGDFHGDPADRLIVATARLRNLTLVTSDERLLRYTHVPTLDTR